MLENRQNLKRVSWGLLFPLFFILLHFPPSFAAMDSEPDRSSSICIGADQQFNFAQHHFNAKSYQMAIIEYQRFIYFFPEDKRVALAMYRIGMAYYSIDRLQQALRSFADVIDRYGGTDLSVKSYLMKSECLIRLNDAGSAVINLQNLIAIADDINVKDEAYYRIGWIYINTASWDQASLYFSKISPQNKNKYKLDLVAAELEKKSSIPRKDPRTAGILSVIPGAGYLYCERYQDALITFLLNGAMMMAAYESFDEGLSALGGLITFVGFGFYAGNVYGAITSAHKYNRRKTDRFIEHLNENLRVKFLVDSENHGAYLALQWVF
jgi:tetratricopeptide (TPR) repeat protein